MKPAPVLLPQGRGAQQFGHAEDAVERRADLVAHGGKEAALGAVGGLGLLLGAAQAGGAPLDPPLQFVTLALQRFAVSLAPPQLGTQGPAQTVEGIGDGVDLVLFA